MVKTPHSQCRGMGLAPGWETKILHATQCGLKKKKIQQKTEEGTTVSFWCLVTYTSTPLGIRSWQKHRPETRLCTNPGSLFVFVDKLVLHSFPIPHLSYLKN